MNREELLQKLNDIFSDIFDRQIVLLENTTANDVDGWDSLTHIAIISTIEETFDMKFSMKEVLGMKNVGEMMDIILREI